MSEDVLNAEEIKSCLHTKWLGQSIYCRETVDSTNTWARRLAEEGAVHGTVVFAEEQTSGKGRRGRGWVMPRGSSVAMTCILRPRVKPRNASMLTLVMGLSTAQACRRLYQLEAMIKWPNDIVISGKKICGILTEMNVRENHIRDLVIGVGINGNLTEFPKELAETAASLQTELGHAISRAPLAAAVLEQFEKNYEEFCVHEDFSRLKEDYNRILVNRNRKVRVLETGNEWEGTARGIDARGELLVEKDNHTVAAVSAGEVSVRGVYGYV